MYFIKALLEAFNLDRASKEEIPDDRCVACSAKDLTSLGENAYRCNICGYEGGSGLAKIHEDREKARMAALSPQQKRKAALRNLRDAKTLLVAVEGTFDGAINASLHDLVGIGGDPSGIAGEGGEKHKLVQGAMGEVEQARVLVKDALFLLGRSVEVSEAGEMSGSLAAVDIYLDNPITDLMAHGKIEELKKKAAAIESDVDALLAELSAS